MDLRSRGVWAVVGVSMDVLWGATAAAAGETKQISFSREIAPVLVKQCQACHGPEKAKGKYRLDSFARLKKAGESDEAPVVAGKPEQSHLYKLITAKDEDDRMPQKADPLPAGQV